MDKYFEQNRLVDDKPIELHEHLVKVTACVASNLFFHEAIDHMESEEHRIILAKSAFTLIAVCEAILDRVDEDERETAFKRVRDKIKPHDMDGLYKQLFDIMRKELMK